MEKPSTLSGLTEQRRRFILHWGEMGSRWGINRGIAQIHALLICSDRPLHAQEIGETLALARSNVSIGLRELLNWGVIRVQHQAGDRRDYFESLPDMWAMCSAIADQRISRELEPTLKLLDELLADDLSDSVAFAKKLKDMHDIIAGITALYKSVRSLPPGFSQRVLKLDKKISELLGKMH